MNDAQTMAIDDLKTVRADTSKLTNTKFENEQNQPQKWRLQAYHKQRAIDSSRMRLFGLHKMIQVECRVLRRRKAVAWNRWLERVNLELSRSRLICCMLKRRKARLQYEYWQQWCKATLLNKQTSILQTHRVRVMRNVMRQCFALMKRQMLSRGWSTWRGYTMNCKAGDDLHMQQVAALQRVQRAVYSLTQRHICVAWKIWLHMVSTKKHNKALIVRVVGRMTIRLVSVVWRKWRLQAYRKQRAIDSSRMRLFGLHKMIQVECRVLRRRKAVAWNRWLERVNLELSRSRLICCMLKRRKARLQYEYWQQWCKATLLNKQTSILQTHRVRVMRNVMRQCFALMKRQMLSRGWSTWRGYTIKCKAGDDLHIQRKCLAYILYFTTKRRRYRYLLLAWRTWKNYTVATQSVLRAKLNLLSRVNIIANAIQRLQLTIAWHDWIDYISLHKLRTGHLRCISRILLRNFVSRAWFTWTKFDSKIKDSNRRSVERKSALGRLHRIQSIYANRWLHGAMRMWKCYAVFYKSKSRFVFQIICRNYTTSIKRGWNTWQEHNHLKTIHRLEFEKGQAMILQKLRYLVVSRLQRQVRLAWHFWNEFIKNKIREDNMKVSKDTQTRTMRHIVGRVHIRYMSSAWHRWRELIVQQNNEKYRAITLSRAWRVICSTYRRRMVVALHTWAAYMRNHAYYFSAVKLLDRCVAKSWQNRTRQAFIILELHRQRMVWHACVLYYDAETVVD